MIALALVVSLITGNSIDKDLVRKIITAKNPAFRACYETALNSEGPEFTGRATLVITIESDGKVSDVKVDFPRENPKFTGCLHDAAMSLHFPKFPPPGPIRDQLADRLRRAVTAATSCTSRTRSACRPGSGSC
ncbi:MAG: AgmX/PglI C-terminal domain-containing protein [Archangium sp.]